MSDSLEFMYNSNTHAVILHNTCHGGSFKVSRHLEKELLKEDYSDYPPSMQYDNKPLIAAMERIGSLGEGPGCSMACVMVPRAALNFINISNENGRETVNFQHRKFIAASMDAMLKTKAVDATSWANIQKEAASVNFTHSTVVTVKPPGSACINKYVMFLDPMEQPHRPCCDDGLGSYTTHQDYWIQKSIMEDFILKRMLDLGCIGYTVDKGNWHVFVSGDPWAHFPCEVMICHKSRQYSLSDSCRLDRPSGSGSDFDSQSESNSDSSIDFSDSENDLVDDRFLDFEDNIHIKSRKTQKTRKVQQAFKIASL